MQVINREKIESTYCDEPIELGSRPDVHLFVQLDALDEHVILGHGTLADVDHAAFSLCASQIANSAVHRRAYIAAELWPTQTALEPDSVVTLD